MLVVLLISCNTQSKEKTIYGNWSVKFRSGPLAEARFKQDGTHDYFVNGKLFSSGKSVFTNDTLKTFDPICEGLGEYYGVYKVAFLQGDSLQFIAIEDSCKPRIYDLDKAVLHRIRK